LSERLGGFRSGQHGRKSVIVRALGQFSCGARSACARLLGRRITQDRRRGWVTHVPPAAAYLVRRSSAEVIHRAFLRMRGARPVPEEGLVGLERLAASTAETGRCLRKVEQMREHVQREMSGAEVQQKLSGHHLLIWPPRWENLCIGAWIRCRRRMSASARATV
jgi:hypothetical protein